MPGHSTHSVAVIVLNWNNAADTTACVESLLRMDRDAAVFVVDNASTDASMSDIRNWARVELPKRNAERAAQGRAPYTFEEHREVAANVEAEAEPLDCVVHLIQSGANLGYAGGNNVGLRAARRSNYAFYWVLNNDTRVADDALSRALDRIASDTSVGLCGSTLVYMDAPETVQCRGGGSFQRLTGRPGQIGQGSRLSDRVEVSAIERQMRYISGAATLVRREIVDQVGFMDEGYFLYFEELEWASQAKGKYRLGYAPKSIVYHKVGASIGTDDRGRGQSDLAVYYMTRGRIRYCLRHSRISLPFVVLDTLRSIVCSLFGGKHRRARVIASAALWQPLESG